MLKTLDEPKVVAPAEALDSADALRAWIVSTSLPRVARLDQVPKNQAAMRRVFEFPAPKVLAFADFTTGADVESTLQSAMESAAKAHTQLRFVIGDANGNDHALQFFGITKEGLPAAVIHDTRAGEKKFVRTGMDFAELDAWVTSFEAGELQPTIKSEPVPEPNDGPVTVLVAKNFDAIVNAPGKTVLLEFYGAFLCNFELDLDDRRPRA
jgi:protein disulfide-isomerase A1